MNQKDKWLRIYFRTKNSRIKWKMYKKIAGTFQFIEEPIRVKGICTVCWENSTKDSKYSNVCDKCLPLLNKENLKSNAKS